MKSDTFTRINTKASSPRRNLAVAALITGTILVMAILVLVISSALSATSSAYAANNQNQNQDQNQNGKKQGNPHRQNNNNNNQRERIQLSPTLSVTPSVGSPGTTATLTGAGFRSNSIISLSLGPNALPTTESPLVSDAVGTFAATIVIPQVPANTYPIVASDGSSSPATAAFTVTAQSVLPPQQQPSALGPTTPPSIIQ